VLCANSSGVCFHSINWLPFATFCTVMCETSSGLIILRRAAGAMYWNKSRFSQWTFAKLLPGFLCACEELVIKYFKINISNSEQYFYFHVLFVYSFITSHNTDRDVNWWHILCCTSTWRPTKRRPSVMPAASRTVTISLGFT